MVHNVQAQSSCSILVSGSPPFDHAARVRASGSPPFDHAARVCVRVSVKKRLSPQSPNRPNQCPETALYSAAPTTFIFVVTKHLTTVSSKLVWYIDIYFHLHKAYFNNCR